MVSEYMKIGGYTIMGNLISANPPLTGRNKKQGYWQRVKSEIYTTLTTTFSYLITWGSKNRLQEVVPAESFYKG